MATYTYEQLLALNHSDLSCYNLRLCGFFKDIAEHSNSVQVGKDVRPNYPNKHNIYFNKLKTRPKKLKSSDPEQLKKIRAILAKLSPSNVDAFQTQLIELFEQSTEWRSVAELFFTNIIDSIFIVDVYARLLIRLETKYPLLIHHIHHLSRQEAREPRQFDTDNITESAEEKTRRWATANGLFIVELFHRGKYRRAYLNEIIQHWLDTSTPENPFFLEIMIKILPKLKKKHLDPSVMEKLTQVTDNKAYKARIRCLLEVKE